MSFCSEKNIIMLLTQLMKFTFREQRELVHVDVYVLYAARYNFDRHNCIHSLKIGNTQ